MLLFWKKKLPFASTCRSTWLHCASVTVYYRWGRYGTTDITNTSAIAAARVSVHSRAVLWCRNGVVRAAIVPFHKDFSPSGEQLDYYKLVITTHCRLYINISQILLLYKTLRYCNTFDSTKSLGVRCRLARNIWLNYEGRRPEFSQNGGYVVGFAEWLRAIDLPLHRRFCNVSMLSA